MVQLRQGSIIVFGNAFSDNGTFVKYITHDIGIKDKIICGTIFQFGSQCIKFNLFYDLENKLISKAVLFRNSRGNMGPAPEDIQINITFDHPTSWFRQPLQHTYKMKLCLLLKWTVL